MTSASKSFNFRFDAVFSDCSKVKWFYKPHNIRERLKRLLAKPLALNDANCDIYWSRGIESNYVATADVREDILVLNGDEMSICAIAAVRTNLLPFVYLDVAPLPPTGLYKSTEEQIRRVKQGISDESYYWEEFGIVDGKHLITRDAVDDGFAYIEGTEVELKGRCEVRCRYVTAYNFIITSAASPLVKPSYDLQLEDHMDAMLRKEKRLRQLIADVGAAS